METPLLNGNWVDLIILAILVYYASGAFRYGFFFLLADFTSFLGSLVGALYIYKFIANFLESNFKLPVSFNNALGFIIAAIVLEMILQTLFVHLVTKLPKKVLGSKLNKYLGLLPALGQGLI